LKRENLREEWKQKKEKMLKKKIDVVEFMVDKIEKYSESK
jgi:predicted glycosyltransferase